jgi:hypothetical protein
VRLSNIDRVVVYLPVERVTAEAAMNAHLAFFAVDAKNASKTIT